MKHSVLFVRSAFFEVAGFLLLGSCTLRTFAQEKKNQLGFNVGGEFMPANSLSSPAAGAPSAITYSSSLALQLNYGREIHGFRAAELWFDLPALVGPNHKITNGNANLPTSNATFYVTPGVRLAFTPKRVVSPWLAFGGGYGLFETSDAFNGGGANPQIHTHTGVLQFGAGADVKTPLHLFVPIGFRGEFRDFYALSSPYYTVPVSGGSQHDLTVSGGVFLRF